MCVYFVAKHASHLSIFEGPEQVHKIKVRMVLQKSHRWGKFGDAKINRRLKNGNSSIHMDVVEFAKSSSVPNNLRLTHHEKNVCEQCYRRYNNTEAPVVLTRQWEWRYGIINLFNFSGLVVGYPSERRENGKQAVKENNKSNAYLE